MAKISPPLSILTVLFGMVLAQQALAFQIPTNIPAISTYITQLEQLSDLELSVEVQSSEVSLGLTCSPRESALFLAALQGSTDRFANDLREETVLSEAFHQANFDCRLCVEKLLYSKLALQARRAK